MARAVQAAFLTFFKFLLRRNYKTFLSVRNLLWKKILCQFSQKEFFCPSQKRKKESSKRSQANMLRLVRSSLNLCKNMSSLLPPPFEVLHKLEAKSTSVVLLNACLRNNCLFYSFTTPTPANFPFVVQFLFVAFKDIMCSATV